MQNMPAICELREDNNFALLIRQLREGSMRQLERNLAEVGVELNYSQYLVLKILAKFGVQTPGDLARWLDHNAGAMTRLLDRLEDKGYVRRHPHAEDRRALRIELTEAGQALWRMISRSSEKTQNEALHDLSESERQTLFALLVRVRDTMEKAI
jgi:DNA-binding MarR family transcriptional regulator